MGKWSLAYEIIKFYFKFPYFGFYRKIVVEGLENIPKNKPIIFAPNHQNAILDPLTMIYSTNKQPVFLARGDAFNNKTIAKIFAVFKILPVFRQRDGISQLKKNEAVFQKSVDVLKNNNAFCLFPEGQHNPQRFLRPLQKAIPRIAFQAEEQSDFKLDIKIIPLGIYYEDKTKSLGIVHIHYGKAIDVLDFVDLYKENPQKGMSALKQRMSEELKPLMIDIQDKENYNLIEDILTVYIPYYLKESKLKNNQKNRFNASKKIIERLTTKFKSDNSFLDKTKDIFSDIKKDINTLNIILEDFIKADRVFSAIMLKILLLLIFFPLFAVNCIFNFLPHLVAPYISKNLLKDPQYLGSVKFGVGGVVFPIYYLLISLISIFFIDVKYALILLFSLPILGLFGVYYKFLLKNINKSIKYLLINKDTKDSINNKINSLYKHIDYIHSK